MTSPDRRITVVVITHNRRAELDRTLCALAALPERPEVVVVDNGSTDGTGDAVRQDHPGVVLLEPGANLGAVGRNLAVEVVDTPYVAFCDDDTWWEPGSVSAAAELLDAHPRLAVVTALIRVEPSGHVDAISLEMGESPLARSEGLPGHPLLSFLAGASAVRRSAFLDVGGFSPRLWLGGEEELLAADLVAAGWHLAYVPELVVHHHASRARDAHLRRRHGIRNALWFSWLRRPARSAARRTWHLVRTTPRDLLTLRAFCDAARGLPWVLRDRRVVPPEVERGYRLLDEAQMRSGTRRYVS